MAAYLLPDCVLKRDGSFPPLYLRAYQNSWKVLPPHSSPPALWHVLGEASWENDQLEDRDGDGSEGNMWEWELDEVPSGNLCPVPHMQVLLPDIYGVGY
jgi:hypothetical protein